MIQRGNGRNQIKFKTNGHGKLDDRLQFQTHVHGVGIKKNPGFIGFENYQNPKIVFLEIYI